MDFKQTCKFLTFGVKRNAPSFSREKKEIVTGSECIDGDKNSTNAAGVKQELIFAGWEHTKTAVLKDVIRKEFQHPALVYVQSNDRGKQLYCELSSNFNQIHVGLVSCELSNTERDIVLNEFRAGKIWILICTEMVARGLDLTDLNLVINFDLPTSVMSYNNRINRTGQAGRPGRAVTLFTTADFEIVRPIATVIHQAGFTVPEYLLKLNKVTKSKKAKLKKKAPKRRDLVPGWKKAKNHSSEANSSVVNQEAAKQSVLKKKHLGGMVTKGNRKKPFYKGEANSTDACVVEFKQKNKSRRLRSAWRPNRRV